MKNVLIAACLVLAAAAASSAQTAGRRRCQRVAPTVDQILSLKRAGSAGDLSGRPLGRVHHPRNQLGRQRLRNEIWLADAIDRRDASADQREEVEPVAGVVAGRLEARLHLGPHRQAADLSDQPAGRRSRRADQPRGRRQQLCLVARRQDDRVHRDRAEVGGDQGPREEIRRIPGRRAGPPDDAPVHDRRRDARDAYADERRLHRRQLRVVARRQKHRLRSPREPGARQRRLGRHLDRHGGRRVRPQARSRRTAPTRIRSGRPTARASPSRSSMANPAFFYSNSLIATVPASGGAPAAVSSAFDEDPSIVAWKPGGLFFAASARTYAYLYNLDPDTQGGHESVAGRPDGQLRASRCRRTGRRSPRFAPDATSMAEVYRRDRRS